MVMKSSVYKWQIKIHGHKIVILIIFEIAVILNVLKPLNFVFKQMYFYNQQQYSKPSSIN